MQFKDQVQNLELGIDTTPKVFIKWENTEEGRDKKEMYQRMEFTNNVFSEVYYVNTYGKKSVVHKTNQFWQTLEDLYQSAKSKGITHDELIELGFEVKGTEDNDPFYQMTFKAPCNFGIYDLSGSLENGIFDLYGNRKKKYTHISELKMLIEAIGNEIRKPKEQTKTEQDEQ
jgi:hypothetical protein